MRSAVLLAAVVAAAVAVLGSSATVADEWQIHRTAAGQAAARAAVPQRGDFNPKGLKGGFIKPDLGGDSCPDFHPKQSDLVVIGAAESDFWWDDGTDIDSRAVVLKTAEMVGRAWQRGMTLEGEACAKSQLAKQLASGPADSRGRLRSYSRISIPRFAKFARAYRAVVALKRPGDVRTIDILMLGHGRAALTYWFTVLSKYESDLRKMESQIVPSLVARASLESRALAVDAFPHASVERAGGTASDVATAGTDVVGVYSRYFTFPDAKNPPYEFVRESLFAAATPAAAARTYAKLQERTHTRAGVATYEGDIADDYMLTVLLPVKVTAAKPTKLQLGDTATQVLFNAHSECCTFEAAVVILHVRTTVAVLYIGAVNTLDRTRLSRLEAQAVERLRTAP